MPLIATPEPYTPPMPAPRVIPPNARPSLQGYARYFRIMATNPLEIWTEGHFTRLVHNDKIFGRDYAIVHDPEFVRHYLVTNAENYGLTPMRRAVFEPIIRDGLLIAEGDLWKRTRRALTPVFTPRHVSGFAPIMRDVAERAADEIAAGEGASVGVTPRMLTLALDVLTACLFSDDAGLDGERFSRNLDRLLHVAGMPHPFDLIGAPKWAPRIGRGEAHRIVLDLRRQVGEVLARRRAAIANGAVQPNDFLGLLINAGVEEGAPLSDQEIVDNLITFLSAGHETTARSLAWTLYLLAKDNDVFRRVAREVDGASLDHIDPENWAGALPFLVAVLKESMRLYPAASIISRHALDADQFGDHKIKPETEMMTSPWVLHRHRELWADPDAFKPDRFLGEAAKKIHRFAYIPFGAGPRVCIGASFSMQEMVIILATFVKRFSMRHVGELEPQPVMRITIQPSTAIEMVFDPRD